MSEMSFKSCLNSQYFTMPTWNLKWKFCPVSITIHKPWHKSISSVTLCNTVQLPHLVLSPSDSHHLVWEVNCIFCQSANKVVMSLTSYSHTTQHLSDTHGLHENSGSFWHVIGSLHVKCRVLTQRTDMSHSCFISMVKIQKVKSTLYLVTSLVKTL